MNRRQFLSLGIVSSIVFAGCAPVKQNKRIVLIGDSTVADYKISQKPLTGWGEVLREYLRDDIEVVNLAVPGSSTRRFAERYWASALTTLRSNDILLIQFGHVDASSDAERHAAPDGLYRRLLLQFVQEGRNAAARPVLVTPVARYRFANGKIVDTHGRYSEVVREAAKDTNTPLIDLASLSALALQELGEDHAREWFMLSYDGNDTTHLSRTGAEGVASIVITSLGQLGLLR